MLKYSLLTSKLKLNRYDTFTSIFIVAYSFELLVHKPSNKRIGRKSAEMMMIMMMMVIVIIIIIMQDVWFSQPCWRIQIVLGYDAMLIG